MTVLGLPKWDDDDEDVEVDEVGTDQDSDDDAAVQIAAPPTPQAPAAPAPATRPPAAEPRPAPTTYTAVTPPRERTPTGPSLRALDKVPVHVFTQPETYRKLDRVVRRAAREDGLDRTELTLSTLADLPRTRAEIWKLNQLREDAGEWLDPDDGPRRKRFVVQLPEVVHRHLEDLTHWAADDGQPKWGVATIVLACLVTRLDLDAPPLESSTDRSALDDLLDRYS